MSSSYLPATTDSIAQALEAKAPSEAISILYRILEYPSSSYEALRIKEQAITNLTDLLRQENRADDLRNLLTQFPFAKRWCSGPVLRSELSFDNEWRLGLHLF
ncbi:unnamed protein product [Prunus armeniaca]